MNIQEIIEFISKFIAAYVGIIVVIIIVILWYIITLKRDIANTQVNTNNIEIETDLIFKAQQKIIDNQDKIIRLMEINLEKENNKYEKSEKEEENIKQNF